MKVEPAKAISFPNRAATVRERMPDSQKTSPSHTAPSWSRPASSRIDHIDVAHRVCTAAWRGRIIATTMRLVAKAPGWVDLAGGPARIWPLCYRHDAFTVKLPSITTPLICRLARVTRRAGAIGAGVLPVRVAPQGVQVRTL